MSEAIALVYHFPPSEIDAMEPDRFMFFAKAADARLKAR
jgi:hypothetical protein